MRRLVLVVAVIIGSVGAAAVGPTWAAVEDGRRPFADVHFGTYYALVIGNNEYTHLPGLKTAVSDAKAVAELLETDYGFETTLLINATRGDVIGALAHQRATRKPDDNLLIYYAGHGVIDTITGEGYWLPVDAEADVPTNWVSVYDITNMLQAIRSRHVMVVADSCYSGTLVRAAPAKMKTADEREVWIKRMLQKRSRTALVSGGLEPVADSGGGGTHSVFARAFLNALAENPNVIEGQGLFDALKRPVVLNADQTPQYSDIRRAGHEGGEFLFKRVRFAPEPAAPPVATAPAAAAVEQETVFWQSIEGSGDPAMFEAYLQRFPEGTFAGLAGLKRDALRSATEKSERKATEEADRKTAREAEIAFWQSIKDSGDAADFQAYLAKYPNGEFAVLADNRLRRLQELQTAALVVAPSPEPPAPVQPAVGVYPSGSSPGETFKDCAECPEMVVIPPGSFLMGDLSGEGNEREKPVHGVRIGYSFAIGKYEVTQAEWRSVMGNDPSEFKADRNPVERVSWSDAKAFVKRLSAKTGKTYRLLSESEWEYVARAGTSTKYWWGNTASRDYANYGADDGSGGLASGRDRWENTSPVGSFSANGFGVHDMHGNVWEWTEDCKHTRYGGAPIDGGAWTAWGDCSWRGLRGGSWYYGFSDLRSADRFSMRIGIQNNIIGFRVARSLDPSEYDKAQAATAAVQSASLQRPAPLTLKKPLDGTWSGSLDCRREAVRKLDHLPVQDGRLIAKKAQSGKNPQSHNFSGKIDPRGGIEIKGSITWQSGVTERLWLFATKEGDRISGTGTRSTNQAWSKSQNFPKSCTIVLTLD